jgi:hypothetical protein
MAKTRRRTFRVVLDLPSDMTVEEMRIYIDEAVRCWRGGKDPESPEYDLDAKSVTTTIVHKLAPIPRDAVPALLAALERCEVAMDTAAVQGVGDVLPPAYRDSWAAAHTAAREALALAKGGTL